MDDEIIHSWCFNDVECFDSTPSAAIIILDKDLESFSSLISHQEPLRKSPNYSLDQGFLSQHVCFISQVVNSLNPFNKILI